MKDKTDLMASTLSVTCRWDGAAESVSSNEGLEWSRVPKSFLASALSKTFLLTEGPINCTWH